MITIYNAECSIIHKTYGKLHRYTAYTRLTTALQDLDFGFNCLECETVETQAFRRKLKHFLLSLSLYRLQLLVS